MDTHKNPDAPLADDLLSGAEAIGKFIGEPRRKVFYLHEIGAIPTFKVGGTIRARKSQLRKRFSAPEVA